VSNFSLCESPVFCAWFLLKIVARRCLVGLKLNGGFSKDCVLVEVVSVLADR